MTSQDDRKSSSEAAYEAEDVRAELAQTLDRLRHNLRPENVMEEVVSNARIGASTLADSLYDIARRNPLPALLVGAGCALFMGLGARTALRSRDVVDHEPAEPSGAFGAASDHRAPTFPPMRDGSPSAPSVWRSGGLGSDDRPDEHEDAPGRLRPLRPDLATPSDDIGEVGRRRRSVARSTRRAAAQLPGILQEQPLILAALGVAAGAAIGAVLPATRTENEWMGPSSTSLRHAAQDAARAELDELRGVAERTADNLKRTAADHGLSADNLDGLVRDVGGHAASAIGEAGNTLGTGHA